VLQRRKKQKLTILGITKNKQLDQVSIEKEPTNR